jgi:predicted deacylase
VLLRMSALLLALALAFLPQTAYPQTAPQVVDIQIGTSAQGRPITGVRIGSGPRKLALVGDTHGLPEANTFELVRQLEAHFRANPQLVPPSVRLYIIPTLNPDGLALGTRFNARTVDLNRNMNTNLDACPENDWSITVQGARGIVSDTGGAYPDSEVESRAVRDLLLDASGAIFYHSNAGNVFPAFCEHAPSIQLAQVYAEAGGYQYERYWSNYAITGGMHDWAASLGIAAIIPELISPVDPEYDQNLAAVLAVLARPDDLLPLPEDRVEAGIPVPALIWRYWKMHGGMEQFGPPLAPAERRGASVRQFFRNAVLELRPDQADTPFHVQPLRLGPLASPGPQAVSVAPPPDAPRFAETGSALYGAFASFWERAGLPLYGYPLSDEYVGLTADGSRRSMQIFERAVLSYDDAAGLVRLEPIGWMALVRERSLLPTQAHQAR